MEPVRSRKAVSSRKRNLLQYDIEITDSFDQCLNCYAKKVRCDLGPEVSICSRCQQHGLSCVLPDGAPDKPRTSIRHVSCTDEALATAISLLTSYFL